MAKMIDWWITCEKTDPKITFRTPATIKHWVEEAARDRNVTVEELLNLELFDRFHKIPRPSDGALRVLNPIERAERRRLILRQYAKRRDASVRYSKPIDEHGYTESGHKRRKRPYVCRAVNESNKELNWGDYLKTRQENIKRLQDEYFNEFDTMLMGCVKDNDKIAPVSIEETIQLAIAYPKASSTRHIALSTKDRDTIPEVNLDRVRRQGLVPQQGPVRTNAGKGKKHGDACAKSVRLGRDAYEVWLTVPGKWNSYKPLGMQAADPEYLRIRDIEDRLADGRAQYEVRAK